MKESTIIKGLFKKLIKAPVQSFPAQGSVKVTPAQGVYIIIKAKDQIVYVGKTNRGKKGLDQRLQNHINGNSSFTIKYLKGKGHDLRYGFKFKYLIVIDNRQRALLEAFTIGVLCPEHIGTGAARKHRVNS